jgi:hypothetical protein
VKRLDSANVRAASFFPVRVWGFSAKCSEPDTVKRFPCSEASGVPETAIDVGLFPPERGPYL